jgi:type I restriction enzyme S subunit
MSGDPKQPRPNWTTTHFGDVLIDSQNGCSVRHGVGEPTVVLRLADVESTTGSVATDGLREVPLGTKDRSKYALRHGDLLAFRVNGSRDIAGRVIVYSGAEGLAYCDHFIRMRINDQVLNPAFAAQGFRTAEVRHQVESKMVSSAGQNTISQETLKSINFPLPPLNEQKRIVSRIDALQARSNAAKDALDAIPPLLEKFRQSVLAAAFRGDLTKEWRQANPDVEPATELRARIRAERRRRWEEANPRKKYVEPEPVDTDGLPELPEGWCWASVEELVATISYGYTESASDDMTGRKFLRITDLTDAGVDWNSVPYCPAPPDRRYDLSAGDIVVARTGATTGKSYRLVDPPSGAVFASYLIRLAPLKSYTGDFLASFMKSPLYWSQIMTMRKGSAQPGVNATVLGQIAVPVCTLAEMGLVIEASEQALRGEISLRTMMDAGHQQIETLNQSILAKAFRGELVPQDPTDEPASVLLERIRGERAAGEGGAGGGKGVRRGRKGKGVGE